MLTPEIMDQLQKEPFPHAVNDDGIFHYENHESLEDEQFELNTGNKDGEQEDIAVTGTGVVNEQSLFSDRSPSHAKQTSSAKQLQEPNTAQKQTNGDLGGVCGSKLDDLAVEAKCATSNESSSDSRGNKDLLGYIDEELEHETELLYEE